jgi:hypothetical protein
VVQVDLAAVAVVNIMVQELLATAATEYFIFFTREQI